MELDLRVSSTAANPSKRNSIEKLSNYRGTQITLRVFAEGALLAIILEWVSVERLPEELARIAKQLRHFHGAHP